MLTLDLWGGQRAGRLVPSLKTHGKFADYVIGDDVIIQRAIYRDTILKYTKPT